MTSAATVGWTELALPAPIQPQVPEPPCRSGGEANRYSAYFGQYKTVSAKPAYCQHILHINLHIILHINILHIMHIIWHIMHIILHIIMHILHIEFKCILYILCI